MNKRVFTVGSLIPGSMIVLQPSPVRTEKVPTESASSERGSSQPAKIIVQQNGSSFEIQPEKGKLLDSALKQGKHIQYKCRKGTCGQCTVKVVQGPGLSAPNEKEKNKLKNALSNGYRLACQAEIL
jgi:ferredoxin, 2Fe-2S